MKLNLIEPNQQQPRHSRALVSVAAPAAYGHLRPRESHRVPAPSIEAPQNMAACRLPISEYPSPPFRNDRKIRSVATIFFIVSGIQRLSFNATDLRHWIARIIPDTRPSGYAKIRSRRIFVCIIPDTNPSGYAKIRSRRIFVCIIPDTNPSGYAKIRSRRIFPAQKTAGMALFGLSANLREIPEDASVRKPLARQRTLTLENDEVVVVFEVVVFWVVAFGIVVLGIAPNTEITNQC